MSTKLIKAVLENCSKATLVAILNESPAELNKIDEDQRTAFHWACSMGSLEAIELFLDRKDATINAQDEAGWTPFMIAICNKNNPESVLEEFLNREDLDISATTRGGQTCLHYAATKGRMRLLQLLCDRKPELVRVKDRQGQQPLHRATAVGNVNAIKILLSHKAPLNASDSCGYTPLHFALAEGHVDAAVELVKAGADTLRVDKEGHTAMQCCPDRIVLQEFIASCQNLNLDL
ncbi:proteasome regulatory particle [Schizosaccharomyces japonicus yFS275]|uniref:Proteasome regulatory particle n=1 Tax=Schizosaccharomyces japonicus (strain yFS275 / FY16936) TaxID=402676 RepID=B6JX27_SCHJY|nr:proteasome regulatory particle [Schizosaccharomyces japonicus yFS275]EEB05928.1 proteasome regulatory particle [Schizosaccharomyces japonicus yFS275]